MKSWKPWIYYVACNILCMSACQISVHRSEVRGAQLPLFPKGRDGVSPTSMVLSNHRGFRNRIPVNTRAHLYNGCQYPQEICFRITTTLKIINSIIKPTGKGCTEPQFLTLRPCPVLLKLHMASLPFPEPLWEVFKNPEIHQHDYLSWKLIEPFKTPKLKQTLI